jgi:hypothetical protein
MNSDDNRPEQQQSVQPKLSKIESFLKKLGTKDLVFSFLVSVFLIVLFFIPLFRMVGWMLA